MTVSGPSMKFFMKSEVISSLIDSHHAGVPSFRLFDTHKLLMQGNCAGLTSFACLVVQLLKQGYFAILQLENGS